MKRCLIRSTVIAAAALVLQLGFVPASFAEVRKEQGSSNGQPFRTLQDEIDLLSMSLAETVAHLQQQIDELVESQADQDDVIAALQGALAELEARVTDNEADIDALEAWNAMQDQLIAALDARLTDLEARVAANEDDIAALVLADQVMQQMIDAIKDEIDVLEMLIAANSDDIADLQTQVADLQSDIAGLQTQLAGKQNRILGVCPAGSSIRQINGDGSVVCETDNVGAGVGTLQSFRVISSPVTIPSSFIFRRSRNRTATCPSTHRVTGGGFTVFGGTLGVGHVDESNPTAGNSWFVNAVSDSAGERTLRAYAQCSRVQ